MLPFSSFEVTVGTPVGTPIGVGVSAANTGPATPLPPPPVSLACMRFNISGSIFSNFSVSVPLSALSAKSVNFFEPLAPTIRPFSLFKYLCASFVKASSPSSSSPSSAQLFSSIIKYIFLFCPGVAPAVTVVGVSAPRGSSDFSVIINTLRLRGAECVGAGLHSKLLSVRGAWEDVFAVTKDLVDVVAVVNVTDGGGGDSVSECGSLI